MGNQISKEKVLGTVFLLAVAAGVIALIYFRQYGPAKQHVDEGREVVCVQKIQLARNPATGEEKIFSTPCEVPKGWQMIDEINESATWQTYANDEYGFELKLPDAWNGYNVVKEQQGSAFGNPTILKFGMKTAYGSKTWYPLQMFIYPIANWNDLTQQVKDSVTFITNNDQYVFTYTESGEPPKDLMDVDFEVPKVIATFAFLETINCGGLAGTPCPTSGYDCQPEGNYPDAMTVCRKR